MMRKPTFFLSSTIFDFKDLRSSIKFYLEQQGCTVLASEFNDFPKQLEAHSYEACLKSIGKADYFVLLIGARVGGWYDAVKKISITQREYREAYALHKQGRLRLLIFVRTEIWNLRSDRKELKKHLETLDLDPGASGAIASFPSKGLSNAEFICSFIDEVSRSEQTKDAVSGKASMPTNNWIHSFDTFADLIDVLQTQVFAGLPIEEASVRRLIGRELREILKETSHKVEGRLWYPGVFVDNFHRTYQIKMDDSPSTLDIKMDHFGRLATSALLASRMRFHAPIIQRALESGVFLGYDRNTGMLLESALYEVLWRIRDEVDSFNLARSGDFLKKFMLLYRNRNSKAKVVTIKVLDLVPVLHVLDRWVNAHRLAVAALRHLRGEALSMPTLRPDSPALDMEEELAAERVLNEDIDKLLNSAAES